MELYNSKSNLPVYWDYKLKTFMNSATGLQKKINLPKENFLNICKVQLSFHYLETKQFALGDQTALLSVPTSIKTHQSQLHYKWYKTAVHEKLKIKHLKEGENLNK